MVTDSYLPLLIAGVPVFPLAKDFVNWEHDRNIAPITSFTVIVKKMLVIRTGIYTPTIR